MFNLREAFGGSLSAEELKEFGNRDFEPKPTIGPVSGVLVRDRERARLRIEQAMEKALAGRSMSVAELVNTLRVSRDAVNRFYLSR